LNRCVCACVCACASAARSFVDEGEPTEGDMALEQLVNRMIRALAMTKDQARGGQRRWEGGQASRGECGEEGGNWVRQGHEDGGRGSRREGFGFMRP
jgi:hypothetical protein